MKKNTKTLLIVGGSIIAIIGGYFGYKKLKGDDVSNVDTNTNTDTNTDTNTNTTTPDDNKPDIIVDDVIAEADNGSSTPAPDVVGGGIVLGAIGDSF